MVTRIVGRILYVIYPPLVFGIALTAWSSSSLSDVTVLTPPVGHSFNFFWNPNLSAQNSCNRDKVQNWNRTCSRSDRLSSIEHISHNQAQSLNKTN